KIYDLTKLLENRPSGDNVLLSAIGKDTSADFKDVGHSSNTRAVMDKIYVGDIDVATILSKVEYKPPKQPHYNHDKTPGFIIKVFQFLVPLLILGFIVGLCFLHQVII
ncbi:Cytochrome b5, partial [Bienertia sinuspersici]